MEALLKKLYSGALQKQEERALYAAHNRCFGRRMRTLNASFFPGREKTPSGISSLANGAYASFRNEPAYDGAPAFAQVVTRRLPAEGYLYFWRASATIQFLRREASSHLRARLLLYRSVGSHLRTGFEVVGQSAGEALWSPRGVSLGPRKHRPNIDELQVVLDGARGTKAILAIFTQVDMPLTRNEVAAILERVCGLEVYECSLGRNEPVALDPYAQVEEQLTESQLHPRVSRFVSSLEVTTLRILKARGYGPSQPHRSLNAVSEELGIPAETLRRRERRAFERFRRLFPERAEFRTAARLLASELAAAEVQ